MRAPTCRVWSTVVQSRVVGAFVSLAVLAVLAVLGGLALGVATTFAAESPKWKVGDRVETDIIQATDPARAMWKRGTVVVVDLRSMAYAIQLDPVPGQLPKTQTVPIRPYAENWIRPITGEDKGAPQMQIDTLRVDDHGTVLADRPLLDCAHATQNQPPTRNGSPLPVELAKTLIRCLFEKPSEVGSDGVTTMDIKTFVPGAPRKWIPREDYGAGTVDTLVYPVRVGVDTWHCGQSQLTGSRPRHKFK